MRHGSRPVALALGTLALLGGAVPVAAPVARPDGVPQASADVTIVAVNLRNARGVVRACLTEAEKQFPSCSNPAQSYNMVGDAEGTVTLRFSNVRPGRYAVALLHDENANGKADRAAMMIPTEGFGFSRDAKVRFGPPKFAEAAFDVPPGGKEKLTIRMRYLL